MTRLICPSTGVSVEVPEDRVDFFTARGWTTEVKPEPKPTAKSKAPKKKQTKKG